MNFTWFFDSYGNLIGSAKIAATYSYAVLKSLYWNLGTPGYATATLIDAATGAESVVTVASIDGDNDAWTSAPNGTFDWDTLNATPLFSGYTYGFSGTTALVAPESFVVNNPYLGYALYRVETLSTGAVALEGVNKGTTDTVVANYAEDVDITKGGTYFTAGSSDLCVCQPRLERRERRHRVHCPLRFRPLHLHPLCGQDCCSHHLRR